MSAFPAPVMPPAVTTASAGETFTTHVWNKTGQPMKITVATQSLARYTGHCEVSLSSKSLPWAPVAHPTFVLAAGAERSVSVHLKQHGGPPGQSDMVVAGIHDAPTVAHADGQSPATGYNVLVTYPGHASAAVCVKANPPKRHHATVSALPPKPASSGSIPAALIGGMGAVIFALLVVIAVIGIRRRHHRHV